MSFDNLNNTKVKKLNLVLLTLITVLFIVFIIFFPYLGIIGLALVPVPATLLILGGRIRDGIICAVIASLVLLLLLLDYVLASLAAIVIVAVSFVYRNFIGKSKNRLFIVISVSSLFCAVSSLYVVLVSVISRINFIGEILNSYNVYIDQISGNQFILDYAGLLSIGQSEFDSIIQQTQDILRFFPYIIPGILISLFVIASVINYIASYKMLKRYDVDIEPFPSFKEWDLPWYYCWGAIMGLIMVLIPSTGHNFDMFLDIGGFNLLVVFGLLYLVLGISVLWGIFERFKVPIVLRVIILIIMGLFFGFTIFILPFLGLIDIWVNFRRLKRGQLVQS
jgi:uncharacterized protein YybS (DUF2232 family)